LQSKGGFIVAIDLANIIALKKLKACASNFNSSSKGVTIVAFCCLTCFYKSSNFRTNNWFVLSTKLQVIHFTMDSLPLKPNTTSTQGNFATQIS
jgi:hypothetical protein